MFPNYGTLVTSDWKYDGKECDSNNSRKGIIVRYLSDTTEADNLRGVFGNLGFDYYAASRSCPCQINCIRILILS